jgi:putative cardiolipin synthase
MNLTGGNFMNFIPRFLDLFMSRTSFAVLPMLSALIVAGCAAMPRIDHEQPSHAWQTPETTELGRFFAAYQPADPALSGLLLLDDPRDAFGVRYGAAELATRTLDLQYYLWKGDLTGRLLLWRVLQAADRGVRVRILIDDIYHRGRDQTYAVIAAHPNIDLRIFNPIGNRRAGRNLNFIANKHQLNHRMHNKIFLVDSAVAVLGGRNIGDDYFGIDPKLNFHDIDVLAVGAAAREAGSAFDLYWNSAAAVPVERLTSRQADAATLDVLRVELTEYVRAKFGEIPYEIPRSVEQTRETLELLAKQLIWASTRIVVDPLERFEGVPSAFDELGREMAERANEMITIQTAYLIPSEKAIDTMESLVERGVRLRLMTNSLMSNNHVSVHAHYQKYRKALLEAGVELYEVRADAALLDHYREQDEDIAESHAGLHTKASVVDQEMSVIGSYNMDPRSNVWNSEIGLVVYGDQFARKLLDAMDQEFESANAFRVELDEKGRVFWRLPCEGCQQVWTKEPDSTWWKRFTSRFLSILPIEKEL